MSFGGIMLAASWLTIFLATFIPGVELSLFALSSFFVVLVIGQTTVGNGWIFYLSTCILSLAIIPDKTAVFPYIVFFGLYGLVKYYAERIGKRPVEYVLKFLFFNVSWGLMIFIFKSAFLGNIEIPSLPIPLLAAGAQVMFLLFDEILTRLHSYFHRRFQNVMDKRMM